MLAVVCEVVNVAAAIRFRVQKVQARAEFRDHVTGLGLTTSCSHQSSLFPVL